MVNKAILIGNLGRDPEMRYTSNGTPVCNFSIATNEVYQDRSGQRQKRTEWHNIVVWSKLAEICNQYLTKGKQIYIEGRIQTREWDDRDGNKRRTTEIVANEMKMLSGPGDGFGDSSGSGPSPRKEPAGGETSESIAKPYSPARASPGHRPQIAVAAFPSRTLESIFLADTMD